MPFFTCSDRAHPARVRGLLLLALMFLLPVTSWSAPVATAFFPASGAANVCSDTEFRITFNTPVTPGTSGTLKVYKSAGNVLVDTVNVTAATISAQVGDILQNYNPLTMNGNTVAIHPGNLNLSYGVQYYVTVDAGAFQDSSNNPSAALGAGQSWQFTIKPTAPPAGPQLTVAVDGTGDYCTIQGAVDSLPAGNSNRVVLNLLNGIHEGIVRIPGKDLVTLHGQDETNTVISFENNNNFNTGSFVRAVVSVLADDFTIENLTITNTTPFGGSQAETLMIYHGERCVCRNCRFVSYQDTVQFNGTVYLDNCYIEGNADFIWGTGTTYYNRCEICANNSGVCTTIWNSPQILGGVFVDCTLTKKKNCTQYLARIDLTQFPASQVAYINCSMDNHILPIGWSISNTNASNTGQLRFGEYQSTDLVGNPIDISQRNPLAKQLSAAQARQFRDVRYVLGPGPWFYGQTNTNAFAKPENFLSANSAATNGWYEQGSRTSGQNYGFSSSANAGGPAGEAGGQVTRSTVRSAFADVWDSGDYGYLTLSDPLAASGKIVFLGTNGASGSASFGVGFTSSSQAGLSAEDDELGLLVTAGGRLDAHIGLTGGMVYQETTGIATLVAGRVYGFDFEWNPAGGSNGGGLLTLHLVDTVLNATNTGTVDLTALNRVLDPTFDSFGIFTRSLSSNSTQTATNYVDSLSYSALPGKPCAITETALFTGMAAGQTNNFMTIGIPGSLTLNGPVSVTLVSTNPAVAYPKGAPGGSLTVTFPQNSAYFSTNVPVTAAAGGATLFYLTNATTPGCISPAAGIGVTITVTQPITTGSKTETFDTLASTTTDGWVGFGNRTAFENYGWTNSHHVFPAITNSGEAGGIFERTANRSYFADVTIGTLSLSNYITASGTVVIVTPPGDDMNLYVTFFNTNDAVSNQNNNFMGVEFTEGSGGGGSGRFKTALGFADNSFQYGTPAPGTLLNPPGIVAWNFTYNPTGGPTGNGQVICNYSNANGSASMTNNVSAAQRAVGATFNAFGWATRAIDEADNPGEYYLDNVTYSVVSNSTCEITESVALTNMASGQTNNLVTITIPANITASGAVSVTLASTNPASAYPKGAPGGSLTVTFPQNSPFSSTNVPLTGAATGTALFYLTNASAPACISAGAASGVVVSVFSNSFSGFSDNFSGGSTVASASPVFPGTNSTSYQEIAGKAWNPNPPTVTSNGLTFGLAVASGGGTEIQALFTTTPVKLVNVGDNVQLAVTFSNVSGLLTQDSQFGMGMFNSGQSLPVAGGLNFNDDIGDTGAVTGGAQGWIGYVALIDYPTAPPYNGTKFSAVYTRPPQTGSDNRNQITTIPGPYSTTYGYSNPSGAAVGSANSAANVALVTGGTYTAVLTYTLQTNGAIQITDNIYTNNTNGALLTSLVETDTAPVTNSFDALAFGFRESTATTTTVLVVRSVQVTSNTQQASTPPTAIPLIWHVSSTNLTLTWSDTNFSLGFANKVKGPYVKLPAATSGFTTNTGGNGGFFKLLWP